MFKILIVMLFLISGQAFSNDTLNLVIRDKDVSNFQKVKLYLNVFKTNGEPVTNLDSTMILVEETNTGKKVNPKVTKFFDSDEGVALCFVIDASKSMDGEPLNNVKEGLLKILPGLRAQDKIGISYFNDQFYRKTDFTSDKTVLKNNIKELATGGSSSQIYPSITEAVSWLMENSLSRKILIIMSDGDDNSEMKREEIEALVTDKPISIFTVGTAAEDKNSKVYLSNLEVISSKSKDGFYYRIFTPEDMKNIIPAIYERVKNEYILSYYSYAPVSTNINASLNVSSGKSIVKKDFSYKSPDNLKENAPSLPFWEVKEYLYGSIGAGIIFLALASLLGYNILKKRKFRREKEQEQRLRLQEEEENKLKFDEFQKEYNDLLDKLEQEQNVSQMDREKLLNLENVLNESSKSAFGKPANIDVRRRTMILEGDSQMPLQSHSGRLPHLNIQTPPYNGIVYQIDRPQLSIGRQNADILINDNTVSRIHAIITTENGSYFLQDNNSTNGTFVNGRRVSQSPLKPGDLIRLGNIEIKFVN